MASRAEARVHRRASSRKLTVPAGSGTLFDTALQSRDFYFGVVPALPGQPRSCTRRSAEGFPPTSCCCRSSSSERTVALALTSTGTTRRCRGPISRRCSASRRKAGLAFEMLLVAEQAARDLRLARTTAGGPPHDRRISLSRDERRPSPSTSRRRLSARPLCPRIRRGRSPLSRNSVSSDPGRMPACVAQIGRNDVALRRPNAALSAPPSTTQPLRKSRRLHASVDRRDPLEHRARHLFPREQLVADAHRFAGAEEDRRRGVLLSAQHAHVPHPLHVDPDRLCSSPGGSPCDRAARPSTSAPAATPWFRPWLRKTMSPAACMIFRALLPATVRASKAHDSRQPSLEQ